MTRVYIDTDNAMGSFWGDVDDGFALVSLLASIEVEIAAIGSVFGNTSSGSALANNKTLADFFHRSPLLWQGARRRGDLDSEASRKLSREQNLRIAALGPLTNVAGALDRESNFADGVEDCVVVGSRLRAIGRFPPYFPHEFNLTMDRKATRQVFASRLPLTIVPLDVACTIRTSMSVLAALEGALGRYICRRSRVWSLRCRLLGKRDFAVWDLAAAGYLLRPDLYQVQTMDVRVDRLGMVFFGQGGRPMRVITSFDTAAVWNLFIEALIAARSLDERDRLATERGRIEHD